MKAIALAIALALCSGCAIDHAHAYPNEKVCQPCPQVKFVQCFPEPTEQAVICHYPYWVQDSKTKEWFRLWIPTVCSPGCVDADGAKIPGCK